MQRRIIARAFRPKRFSEVVGQEVIVKTLQNATLHGMHAQCTLFSGSRGTGKTTLARLLAKAMNCKALSAEGEPCLSCISCQEIDQGNSMDVIEIDGASHRGIDDVRAIVSTIMLSPTSGRFKIYIIDEVHMLTNEAFNALLKTLEEPPAHAKFIFATTELHKVPATVVSRSMRFALKRIAEEPMVLKLEEIALALQVEVEREALFAIARLSEGGLRDAEALLDQLIALYPGEKLTQEMTAHAFGVVPTDLFFRLDRAFQNKAWEEAFLMTAELFQAGVHLGTFLAMLAEHYRTHALLKRLGHLQLVSHLSEREKASYHEFVVSYSIHQLLELFQLTVDAERELNHHAHPKLFIESLLLRIIGQSELVPIGVITERLEDLEKQLKSANTAPSHTPQQPIKTASAPVYKAPSLMPAAPPIQKAPQVTPVAPMREAPAVPGVEKVAATPPQKNPKLDTLLQFAAVELEGRLVTPS